LHPTITAAEIADDLVPPRQFRTASFDNYVPAEDQPTQAEAVRVLRDFAGSWSTSRPRGLFAKAPKPLVATPGVYLDGGFGVGKTHLLAALWHAAPGPKRFGTFIEYTALVGALGYRGAVELLRGTRLICIDEFELDDPGDTMIMTRLLGELVEGGTRIAATSNTPPNALGEGRFAASDFLREIHALSDRFTTLRIDGEDYRRRESTAEAISLSETEFSQATDRETAAGLRVVGDSFGGVLSHLATVHPASYVKLVDSFDVLAIEGVSVLEHQTEALRFVAFVDRLYDAQVPIVATGIPLSTVFGTEMLTGGYRKKYQRAISRLIALTASANRIE
jgi:cell division protein ZapE